MFPAITLLIPLCLTVFLLIRAELRGLRWQVYLFKPLSTVLVIAMAALALGLPTVNRPYTWGVLIGLVLSLGGDVALMFGAQPEAFRLGLVFFLLAHIAYIITFTWVSGLFVTDLISAAILALIAAEFYRRLRPKLGAMQVPVAVYVVVISLMVNRALAIFSSPAFTPLQAWMVAAGALLFYLSDVMLAINRFWRPFRFHRLSLVLYFGGQALIALAASYFVG